MKKNIYWLKKANQWMVRIRGHYLGTYNNLEQAEQVLGDFIRLNPKDKKHHVTLTLNSKQMVKFKSLGSQKWVRSLLD